MKYLSNLGKLAICVIINKIIIILFVVVLFVFGSCTPTQTSEPSITEEEYKKASEYLTWGRLSRDFEAYVDKNIYGFGNVDQVIDNKNFLTWDYHLWVRHSGKITVLEDTTFRFWGKIKGTKGYTSALGISRTIPYLESRYLEKPTSLSKQKGKIEIYSQNQTISRTLPAEKGFFFEFDVTVEYQGNAEFQGQKRNFLVHFGRKNGNAQIITPKGMLPEWVISLEPGKSHPLKIYFRPWDDKISNPGEYVTELVVEEYFNPAFGGRIELKGILLSP